MAKGFIVDTLMNRKIEGESSFADADSVVTEEQVEEIIDSRGYATEQYVDGELEEKVSSDEMSKYYTSLYEYILVYKDQDGYAQCMVLSSEFYANAQSFISNLPTINAQSTTEQIQNSMVGAIGYCPSLGQNVGTVIGVCKYDYGSVTEPCVVIVDEQSGNIRTISQGVSIDKFIIREFETFLEY